MKRNMKNTVMNLTDKILLRKHSVIETVNGDLKTICQVELGLIMFTSPLPPIFPQFLESSGLCLPPFRDRIFPSQTPKC